MEIEVGEYYRTKKGLIRKVNTIHTPETRGVSYRKSKVLLVNGKHSLEDILKHSKNIIDLIEVGDYVNGELVTFVQSCNEVIATREHCRIENEDIKSIVTKEQFKNIEYRLE